MNDEQAKKMLKREKAHQYYWHNRERLAEYRKMYYAKNKDHINSLRRANRAKRRLELDKFFANFVVNREGSYL